MCSWSPLLLVTDRVRFRQQFLIPPVSEDLLSGSLRLSLAACQPPRAPRISTSPNRNAKEATQWSDGQRLQGIPGAKTLQKIWKCCNHCFICASD